MTCESIPPHDYAGYCWFLSSSFAATDTFSLHSAPLREVLEFLNKIFIQLSSTVTVAGDGQNFMTTLNVPELKEFFHYT